MLLIKRLVLFVIAIAVIAIAIALSGLNTEKVLLNLYLLKFELSLGFALILALVLGLLIGLFITLCNFYLPLKSQIRQLTRKNRKLIAAKKLEEIEQIEHAND